MGGPKALLVYDGRPLVWKHVDRAREVGCGEIVVVARREVACILDRGETPAHGAATGGHSGARVVVSEELEPAGSLAVGVRALGAASIVLVSPVDVVPASDQTIELLFKAIFAGAVAATPVFGERGGHPVVCRREVLDRYAGERPHPSLRDVLDSLGDRRARVRVSDESVTIDLNRPEDVFARTGAAPVFWRPS